MSERLSNAELLRLATLTDAPPRTRIQRNFDLPTGLYAATVGLYLAFIGVMAGLFLNGELAIPMVIFAGFIVMAFGLAAMWTRMKPDHADKPMTWGQLSSRGIETLSGRLTAHEAAIQVLTLPVLILCWGLAVGVIVTFVR